MPSTATTENPRHLGLRRRVTAYVIPLVATPPLLISSTTVSPAEIRPPIVGQFGGAVSTTGAALDRRWLAAELDVRRRGDGDAIIWQDHVFRLVPSRVRRHAARLIRRTRRLGLADNPEELALQINEHG